MTKTMSAEELVDNLDDSGFPQLHLYSDRSILYKVQFPPITTEEDYLAHLNAALTLVSASSRVDGAALFFEVEDHDIACMRALFGSIDILVIDDDEWQEFPAEHYDTFSAFTLYSALGAQYQFDVVDETETMLLQSGFNVRKVTQ